MISCAANFKAQAVRRLNHEISSFAGILMTVSMQFDECENDAQ
jgi:hypothetical protein